MALGSCLQPVSIPLCCPKLQRQGVIQEVGLSFLIPHLSPFVILLEICWDCCHLYSPLSHCTRIQEIYFLGAIFSNDMAVKPIKPGSDGCLTGSQLRGAAGWNWVSCVGHVEQCFMQHTRLCWHSGYAGFIWEAPGLETAFCFHMAESSRAWSLSVILLCTSTLMHCVMGHPSELLCLGSASQNGRVISPNLL